MAQTPNPIPVPYLSQRDNLSGDGWRECFSSAVAMAAKHWGTVVDDDAYNRVRGRFGDTVDPMAHIQALRHLGLEAVFRSDLTRRELIQQLGLGRPVPVGWLHHGPSWSPRGGGHWSTVIGTTPDGLIVHDPHGDPDLLRGGWIPGRGGESLRFSWRNFGPRWEVEGPGSGWGLLIRPR